MLKRASIVRGHKGEKVEKIYQQVVKIKGATSHRMYMHYSNNNFQVVILREKSYIMK